MVRSPYRVVLGSAWRRVPEQIRSMHAPEGGVARGRATVICGRSLIARLASRAFGLPGASADTSLEVRFEPVGNGELWTRRFGNDVMRTRQSPGRGGETGFLLERLGPFAFANSLAIAEGRLVLSLSRWRFLGLALPLSMGPRTQAVEYVEDGRYRFDITVDHPLTGLIIRYFGWLDPLKPSPASSGGS